MFENIRTKKQAQARLIDIEYETREMKSGYQDFVAHERAERQKLGQRLYEHFLRVGGETMGPDGLREDRWSRQRLEELREEERLLRHHMLDLET